MSTANNPGESIAYEAGEIQMRPNIPVRDILVAEAADQLPFLQRRRYQQELDSRLLGEWGATAQTRRTGQGGWAWRIGEGDYRNEELTDIYVPRPYTGRRPLTEPLRGIELEWTEHLDKLLESGNNEPAIGVDFGGGLGQSMIRVAAQEKYRQAIIEGKLLMVVSGLGAAPPSEPDEQGYTQVARVMRADRESDDPISYQDSELDFMQAHQDLITFVDTNALELEKLSIPTVNGEQIPLMGAVGFIHEKCALTHSHIPDVAMGIFARLLVPGGRLYLDAREPNYLHDISASAGIMSEEYEAQRRLGVTIGKAAMEHMGMRITGDYTYAPRIYTKLSALV